MKARAESPRRAIARSCIAPGAILDSLGCRRVGRERYEIPDAVVLGG
jgi:hypothetical protein